MIEVRITTETAEDARSEMRKLLGEDAPVGRSQVVEAGSLKKTTKTEAPKEPKESKESKEEKAAPAAPATLSVQDIKIRIPKLMDKLGKEKLVPFLATFSGAKKGSEVPESMYADFIAQADAIIAG